MCCTHFFGIEIFDGARDVFGQTEGVEALGYCRLYHFLQCVFGVPAELARVAVVGEGHGDVGGMVRMCRRPRRICDVVRYGAGDG